MRMTSIDIPLEPLHPIRRQAKPTMVRFCDPGPSRQSPDRLLSVAVQPLEDRPPSRIGERSEEALREGFHFTRAISSLKSALAGPNQKNRDTEENPHRNYISRER